MKTYINLKTTSILSITSGIVLTLFAIATLSSCGKHETERTVLETNPVVVEIMEIQASETKSGFSVSGNIQAEDEANLSTRMMGYIEQINAEVGQKVSKGQALVYINSSDLSAKLAQVTSNIKQAEAAVFNVKKDYDRIQKLYEQKSVTQKEWDDIQAHFEMTSAGLEAAKEMKREVESQFAYTKIVAPFSGTVTAKYVHKGEIANPGMPLLTIANTERYQAIAMVPEQQVSSLEVGQKANVLIKSIERTFEGTISEIAISSNNTGSQYMVKLDLPKNVKNLYVGMFATITFENQKETSHATLLIPNKSLVHKGSLQGVYTVGSHNTAILRWLRLGKTLGDQTEVLSGLSYGDTLIVSSNARLYNGAKVTLQ